MSTAIDIRTKEENEALKLANRILMQALEESLKLQAHYAKLLNIQDGGERIVFDSAQAWITRLNMLDADRGSHLERK